MRGREAPDLARGGSIEGAGLLQGAAQLGHTRAEPPERKAEIGREPAQVPFEDNAGQRRGRARVALAQQVLRVRELAVEQVGEQRALDPPQRRIEPVERAGQDRGLRAPEVREEGGRRPGRPTPGGARRCRAGSRRCRSSRA